VNKVAQASKKIWPWIAVVTMLVILLAAGIYCNKRPVNAPPSVNTAQKSETSIAVLPFVNMSGDKDQEYFSDGLTEELLNLLAKIPDLRVIGRTSSFQFKGKNEDLRVIGQKLGVGHLLEGSVRKAGNKVRITAQLVRASDGSHLWSETYDRELVDIFKVQDEIAERVTKELKITLLGGKPYTPGAANPESYNLYLQGRFLAARRNKESFEKAILCFKQALHLHPHRPGKRNCSSRGGSAGCCVRSI
jgi:TolB-like protein